ncbi:MAG: hypothetical protein EBX35_12515 [Planctomycetia bacterium]|nr:hypothetical protein [Planctomycetia bacterium]
MSEIGWSSESVTGVSLPTASCSRPTMSMWIATPACFDSASSTAASGCSRKAGRTFSSSFFWISSSAAVTRLRPSASRSVRVFVRSAHSRVEGNSIGPAMGRPDRATSSTTSRNPA